MTRGTWIIVVLLAGCGPHGGSPGGTPNKPPTPGAPDAGVDASPDAGPPAPPRARREGVTEQIHGVAVRDPYRWLEAGDDAEVKRWAAAQDAHARAYLSSLPGREILRERLKQLHYLDRTGAPIRRGKRYFFSRQHATKEKVVWYWRQGPGGKPRVLIDPNTLSKDGSVSLRGLSISWDGKTVAYKLSRNAADTATLYVMDVASGKVSGRDTIQGARYAHASWTPRGEGFYYTRLPVDDEIPASEMPGHAAVYFHRLGTDPTKDRLIHPPTGDPRTFIFPDLSRDGRLLFLYIMHGWSRTDVYYRRLRRGRPAPGKFRPFVVGKPARYSVVAEAGKVFVRTNEGAPRYRLFRVDPRRMERRRWKEIVAQDREAVLTGFDVVGGHLSLLYMRKASTRLRIARLDGKLVRTVSFPGIGTASGLVGHPEDDTAYYSFSSFTTPTTVYRTSVRRGGREVYFKLEVPVDPKPYVEEQVSYKSRDGTPVTMFIVRSRAMRRDGSTPFLLTGYGGFNISKTPRFSSGAFLWLEQGGGLAVPNLRGGGEYGEKWHRDGMLLRKQNTFDDFIAAAEHLVRKRYTSSSKLAIRGGSNGGLLVGAAMVQRPELFRVVSCHVPLLDMLRYHRFGAGKTWIAEYGSADDPDQFRALHAYSPYHHVKPGTPYPALLMMSADSDDRVDPMHARKFTAAVQYATSSRHKVLLRVETKAGHGGGDLIKKKVAAGTDEFAFLMSELGMNVRPPRTATSRGRPARAGRRCAATPCRPGSGPARPSASRRR